MKYKCEFCNKMISTKQMLSVHLMSCKEKKIKLNEEIRFKYNKIIESINLMQDKLTELKLEIIDINN